MSVVRSLWQEDRDFLSTQRQDFFSFLLFASPMSARAATEDPKKHFLFLKMKDLFIVKAIALANAQNMGHRTYNILTPVKNAKKKRSIDNYVLQTQKQMFLEEGHKRTFENAGKKKSC
jgi:hypothetical protein